MVAIIAGAKALKFLNPWTSNSPRMRLFRGILYGAVSGILSAHSLLVAKSAVELLVRTIIDRHNEFNRWESWIILLSLLALALTQLYYLHRGLKLCSTSILYPFVFCVYNIVAILDGLIYFDQSSRFSLLHALLVSAEILCILSRDSSNLLTYQIFLGTMILLLGVLALSWRLNHDPITRPPVSQNPLTPGMSIVDDDCESEVETDVTVSDVDEEATLANGERTPLLKHSYRRRTWSPPDSKITRLRGRGPNESEEIWEELEDDTISELSPFLRRRSSGRSTPSSRPASKGNPLEQSPNESTALLSRARTGRNYRDTGRRRSTYLTECYDHESRRKSTSSQEALGGWWKMKRWWKGEDRKGKSRGNDNGNGNGV